MKYYGIMDLAGNDLLNLVLGKKTSGVVARTGEIDLVDNQLRVCVVLSDGLTVWFPVYDLNYFRYTQTSKATQWTITHNLNTQRPLAFAFDTTKAELAISSLQVLSANKVALNLTRSVSGTAIIVAP
jgi:hypothetical protein